MVLMVESICGQGFTYAREVEEDRQKKLVKLDKRATQKKLQRLNKILSISVISHRCGPPFIPSIAKTCKASR
jgi:hypothetical protein